jgi:hypothetical protein
VGVPTHTRMSGTKTATAELSTTASRSVIPRWMPQKMLLARHVSCTTITISCTYPYGSCVCMYLCGTAPMLVVEFAHQRERGRREGRRAGLGAPQAVHMAQIDRVESAEDLQPGEVTTNVRRERPHGNSDRIDDSELCAQRWCGCGSRTF